MSIRHVDFKSIVAAVVTVVMFSVPSARAQDGVSGLLERLQAAENETEAQRLEGQIIAEWSKSGSPAMDLLLKRGRDALEVSAFAAAAEHFRALTDHAPAFAEGWHGLALAYFRMERLGPAMGALERVLALNPQHFAALRGVGAIHEQVDRPALAYEAYERVLDLRPHDSDVIEALDRLERQVRGITL
jgi:tetratricopeptide (TPR) repeat protein